MVRNARVTRHLRVARVRVSACKQKIYILREKIYIIIVLVVVGEHCWQQTDKYILKSAFGFMAFADKWVTRACVYIL